MRKNIIMAVLAMASMSIFAKDIKTMVVTTTPVMHCESCENKIKDNLRFEKGIKKIETNVPNQTVTITYDADKNTSEKIISAFGKFGYEAKSVQAEKKCCGKTKSCENKTGECQKAAGDCCKKAESCNKKAESCNKMNACAQKTDTCGKCNKQEK